VVERCKYDGAYRQTVITPDGRTSIFSLNPLPKLLLHPHQIIPCAPQRLSQRNTVVIRLLCFQWTRGSIPDDKAKLERIAGGEVSADVPAKFKDGKNERPENAEEKFKQIFAIRVVKKYFPRVILRDEN